MIHRMLGVLPALMIGSTQGATFPSQESSCGGAFEELLDTPCHQSWPISNEMRHAALEELPGVDAVLALQGSCSRFCWMMDSCSTLASCVRVSQCGQVLA